MINVCFSFDDSVKDTYEVAYPVLKSLNIPFTINVISKNVEDNIAQSMTLEELIECAENGAEIACHGHTHNNTADDVMNNISSLSKMGINTKNIGFASPYSFISKDNGEDIKMLLREGKIAYIRSGISIRREGFLYSVFSYLERMTHSKILFYHLNKRNIIKKPKPELLMSVAITKYTTVNQIMYFLNKAQEGDSIILMFHHISQNNEVDSNVWHFSLEKFSLLCKKVHGDKKIKLMTTIDMIRRN